MNSHYGEIIYRDDAIFVVRKKAGVAVEENGAKRDLYTELKAQLISEGEEPELYIVHRLDRNVEGLLVFARTNAAAAALSEQVRSRQMVKEYLAVVHGFMDPPSGELINHLGKQGSVAFVEPEERPWTKKAELAYETIDKNSSESLLKISLGTGRFHQIRVQLSHVLCPIVGDRKYGDAKLDDSVRFPCLCAYHLQFTHPVDGEKMDFKVMPEETYFGRFKLPEI